MKLALCLIVKASDSEAEVLERALSYAAPCVDGIFITITGENEACEEVAKFYKANVSHFTWVNDFAKARNFNFAQVPKEYTHIAWIDADDCVRNWDNLRTIIEENPASDAFVMHYLYAFDEYRNPTVVHLKTRVVKNDGCVEWVGALHEDFKETRTLNAFFVEKLDILHLTNEERIKDSTERNIAVARASLSDDPRSLWNMGNALKQAGKNEEALSFLKEFLEKSHSDEEKYIIRLRIAEIFFGNKEYTKALEEARYAIGTRPQYPDAYHLAGHILFEMKRYEEAKDSYLMGLKRKPPYNSIIVYNPRDYDYVPLMALAKTYFNLSLPTMALECLKGCATIMPGAEHIKKTISMMEVEAERFNQVVELVSKFKEMDDQTLKLALLEVPHDLQSHPALCQLRNTRFVKTESKGHDLVFFCGYTDEAWTPRTAKEKGIGGSEEAVIHLSKKLVEMGWDVTVYNNCGHQSEVFDGVTYKPFWEWNHRDKQDVTILWRHPRAVDYDINSTKIFVDLHDVVPAGEFNEARLKKINRIFVKSQAHRSLFPNVPDEKFCIVQNGIVWEDLQGAVERDPYLMLNTSSPDRSLSSFIKIFKGVKARVPQAKAVWCYGFGLFERFHSDNPEAMAWKKQLEEEVGSLEGFTALGRVNHGEVAKLYQQAGVFCYPTAFFEIDCISARKAQAGGATTITSDFAALKETNEHGVQIPVDPSKENWGKPYAFDFAIQDEAVIQEFVDEVVKAMENPSIEEHRQAVRDAMMAKGWDGVSFSWDRELRK